MKTFFTFLTLEKLKVFDIFKKSMKNRDEEVFKEITFSSFLCDIYPSGMGISCWYIEICF